MGREEGGGFRMGNMCMPVADSFRYIAEPIQYLKFKNKIKFKKIKKKKKKREFTAIEWIEILHFKRLLPILYDSKRKPIKAKVPFDSAIPVHQS